MRKNLNDLMNILLASAVFALAFYVLLSLLRTRRMIEENKRTLRDRKAIVTFLNRFAYAVSTTDDMNFAIISLSRYIRDAVHAESVCLYFVDSDKKNLQAISTVGGFPSHQEFNGEDYNPFEIPNVDQRGVVIGEGFLGKMASQQTPRLFSQQLRGGEELFSKESSRIKTMMVVPIEMDDELLGMIVVVNSNDGLPFGDADLRLLDSISGHATLAKNMVETYQRLEGQQRLDQELRFARDMQSALMPKSMPTLQNDINIYAINKSAKEVSGDYYDYIQIDENRTLVVIADASGKGVPACMISTMTRSILRSLCSRFSSLEEMLLELNANIYKDIDASRFITMALCIIDSKRHVVECARAGHTDLLFRDAGGVILKLKPKGPAIGLLPNMKGQFFETFSFVLQPGCRLLFFTDGITEALSLRGEEYGEDRLVDLWSQLEGKNSEVVDTILQDVDNFTSSQELGDDQTIMVISRDAEPSLAEVS